jgi:redox-sensitive bicupin YhaK (pirin superfamily)
MKRRQVLAIIASLFSSVSSLSWAGGLKSIFASKGNKVIKKKYPIDFQWPTIDPFLFCVHHYDHYPQGNKNHGLDSKHFTGRQMGSDFVPKDGFRLYHGKEIPGFPVHPHRGFETITIVRKGYVDHADSLGAAGRYGEGDVQWMTAGGGVQHSEMFPLLHAEKENTLELFQIWLNLPAKNKMVPADFKMLWADKIPTIKQDKVEVSLISGEYADQKIYPAPKNSWAADSNNQVNIMLVKMQKDGIFNLAARENTNLILYFFVGNEIQINGQGVGSKTAMELDSSQDLKVVSTEDEIEFLILQSKPISEPVVQHGPFVMNTREEVMKAFSDYQQTQFGGWPWERNDMIHGSKIEKFAKYPNGKMEKPENKS